MQVKPYDRKLAESLSIALFAANDVTEHSFQIIDKEGNLGTYGYIRAALENVIGSDGVQFWAETGELPEIMPETPDVELSPNEVKALQFIYNQGMDAMGGKKASDLLDDNMSWFSGRDMMNYCGFTGDIAKTVIASLLDKHMVCDYGESVNGARFYLSDSGIITCGAMFDLTIK